MKRYEEAGETIMLVLPETNQATLVEFEPEANPRRARPETIILPPGPYEDLFVRVALVRHPEYGQHKDVTITKSADVYKLTKSMENLPQESMFVLLLNSQNKVVGITEAIRGSWNKALIEPTDIFRAAVVANAPAIIVVHNHPSGNAKESVEDLSMMRNLQKAGGVLGIKILDSIIIGNDQYISLADRGLL